MNEGKVHGKNEKLPKGLVELALDLGIVTTVTVETTGRRKFTKFVSDHVFRDKHGKEILAVMHHESVSNKVGSDHGPACPGLDRTLGIRVVEFVNLEQKLLIDKRSFFE